MIVVKYGGHALPTPGSRDPIMQILAERFKAGTSIVLVHGGGPQIDAAPKPQNPIRMIIKLILIYMSKLIAKSTILESTVNKIVVIIIIA